MRLDPLKGLRIFLGCPVTVDYAVAWMCLQVLNALNGQPPPNKVWLLTGVLLFF